MPSSLSQLFFLLLVIGPIIVVHELGHFAVAKAFGMRVLAFSVGFGKRLWGFQRGETEYKLCILPLGGYVKLSGEEEAEASDDPRDFVNRPRWQRVIVYLAGPLMNAVFSIVLVSGLFMVGIDVPTLQGIPPVVGAIEPGSPAAAADLRPGDLVVSIDGRRVSNWGDVALAISTSAQQQLEVEVEREDGRITTRLTPVVLEENGLGDAGMFPKVLPHVGTVTPGSPAESAGLLPGDEIRAVDGRRVFSGADFVEWIQKHPEQTVLLEVVRDGRPIELAVVPKKEGEEGRIGVSLVFTQRFPPLQAIVEGTKFNVNVVSQTLVVIGKVVSGKVPASSVFTGPVGIAKESDRAARRSFKDFLLLMGIVSISIGLLNLFPIPILDGGQISVLLVESVVRRDLSTTFKERLAIVGLALIVLLMVAVFWFDIAKYWLRPSPG